MKRAAILVLAAQAVVMVGPPALTRLAVSLDIYFVAVMAILLVIHPLCCLGTGIFAGLDTKTRWWLVLTGTVLALCGDWLSFAFSSDFLFYAGLNLLLGLLGLTATTVVRRAIKRKA